MSWTFECPVSQDLRLECASRDPLLMAIWSTRQLLRAVSGKSAPWCSSAGHPWILILQLQVRIRSFPASHPSGSSTSTTVPLRDPLYPGSTHGAPYLAAGHQTLPSELQVLSSSSCRMTSRQPASSGLPSRPGYLLRMDLASRLLGAPNSSGGMSSRIQVHLAAFHGSSFGIRCLARMPTTVMLRGGTVV